MMRNSQMQGFTLLEMVLVVLLLGVISTMSLSFIDNQDNQRRYQESLQKLDTIGTALLSESRYRDQPMYAGFVVDNGFLPPAATPGLQPLIAQDGVWNVDGSNIWATKTTFTPAFNFVNGGTPVLLSTIDTSDSADLKAPILKAAVENSLQKGYRGKYLSNGLDSSQEFRDGWGRDFLVTINGNELCYKYLGYLEEDDSSPDSDACNDYSGATLEKPSGYDSDIIRELKEAEWSIAPSELNITLKNKHSTDATGIVRAAVLIFRNSSAPDGDSSGFIDSSDEAKSLWRTYYFEVAVGINALDSYNSLSAIPDWLFEPDAVTPVPTTDRIPVGQHMVVVFDEDEDPANNWSVDDITAVSLFNVFPGMTPQPEVVLVAKE